MTIHEAGLIAILRGVTPAHVVAVASAVWEAGFDAVEVPLNSPDPLESIRRICRELPAGYRVGAGTVLTPDDVHRAADAGARMIVSPNTKASVVSEAVRLGLESYPGAATPSEAFVAVDAGARAIKLFPADSIGISGMRAWAGVLPTGTQMVPVGGVDAGNLGSWAAAGASGAGIGTSLYRPGDPPDVVHRRAAELVRAWTATIM